jgi:hypothetical protein
VPLLCVRTGPLLADDKEFVIRPDTQAWLTDLPSYRDVDGNTLPRQILTEFDSGCDELALQHKKAFVERTLPCVDPSRVELFMRCLYCNVQPNGSSGSDFLVGIWRRDTRRVAGRRSFRTTGRIVTAVGFSGEGFKCAMVVGTLQYYLVETAKMFPA